MRPQYRIYADDRDITARIAERLLDLSITDESGYQSDSLTITVDDAEGRLAVPRKGARLAVHLGYQETGLVFMGEFLVDEPELSGPPDKIVIRAKGADFLQEFKSSKTRSWDQMTLDNIVRVIAAEHGLQPRVAESLAHIFIAHIDQTGESDLHFLTRLAQEYDAVAKPAGPNLVFLPRDQGKTASGQVLPTITLLKSEVTRYRLVLADRTDIGHVVAYWQDKNQALRVGETVGDPDLPGKTLRQTYPTAAEARAAATSELAVLQRGRRNLNITLPGAPLLIAESPITLTGAWRDGFAGDYVVERVEHRLGSGGYTTSFTAH